MEKLNVAIIGYGARGSGWGKCNLANMDDIEVVAICDVYADRVEFGQADMERKGRKRPFGTTDYHAVLNMESLDAVLITSSWEMHVPMAIDAMKKGIAVAMEVGGAYSLESLWELVHVQRETNTPFMFLENCCFGKEELLGTSFVRNGLLGDVVYCHGAYAHYLADEIAGGNKNRHYRLRNYLSRNGENYPTHELGPIAKVLNINRGNRMVSLVSVASKSVGMKDYISRHASEYPELVGREFKQGDIINTIITCADGSQITLRLDTTLPRSYSREFLLRGTRGYYEQDHNLLFLDGDREFWSTQSFYRENLNNAAKYEAQYLPREWSSLTPAEIEAGHGGMDYLVFRAFVKALRSGSEMPIDVYDGASWMAVTALSEASVAAGGAPQSVPDFTDGLWTIRPPKDVIDIPIV